MWASRASATSLTMRFEAYCAADRTHARDGPLTVVCVEKSSITKRPIPDWVKDALSRTIGGVALAESMAMEERLRASIALLTRRCRRCSPSYAAYLKASLSVG
jgi:hypothetical protein